MAPQKEVGIQHQKGVVVQSAARDPLSETTHPPAIVRDPPAIVRDCFWVGPLVLSKKSPSHCHSTLFSSSRNVVRAALIV